MRLFISIGYFFIFLSKLALAVTDTRFVFFGDFGNGSQEQKNVAKAVGDFCKKQRCDFVASLGDNFYDTGVKDTEDPQWKIKFEDVYGFLKLPFYVSLGNHDHEGNILAQIAYSKKNPLWHLPSNHYTFQKGGTDFFVIDSNKFDRGQRKLLVNLLRSSQSCWKIAYGHHPIYSYGEHGPTKELVKHLEPLIKGQVDFYLAGHDHDKQVIHSPDGLIYVVTGTGGAHLRPTQMGEGSVFAKSSFGFGYLSIEGRQAILKLLDQNGNTEFSQTYLKPIPSLCR